jgi:hypothetical protein
MKLNIEKVNTGSLVMCYYNKLKFSTLPILTGHYVYLPQDTINGGLKSYTDTIDLSSEYNINGHITNYEWFDITSAFWIEEHIEQPTNINGVFYFTEAHKDKKLRCKMYNEQFYYEVCGPDGCFPVPLVYETNMVAGISDNPVKHFKISPNPTSFATVAAATFDLLWSGEVTLEVCDITGSVLYSVSNFYAAGEHTIPINIKNIAKGSYICRLLLREKQIGTANFVVGK